MFTRRFVVGSLLALVLIGMSGAVSAQDSERFFVTGFVRTPGSFILEPNMTVGDGIDIAGGVTDRGSLSGVLILRKVSGATQTIEVALTDKLQANDTIRVRQKI